MRLSLHSNNTKDVFTTGWESVDLEFEEIPDFIRQDRLMGYCSNSLVDGSRAANEDPTKETGIERYDGKESVIILDIDNKPGKKGVPITIPQAVDIFREYKYIIVTTKSHSQEFHNFRLFLQLNLEINSYEDRKILMEYIYKTYSFIDQSCKNCNRLFYTSPKNAMVYDNLDGKIFDAKYIIENGSSIASEIYHTDKVEEFVLPEPKNVKSFKCWLGTITQDIFKQEEMEKKIVDGFGNEFESSSGELDEDAKLKGVEIFLEENYYPGNKGNCLFRASSMMKSDGCFTDDFIADYLVAHWQTHSAPGDKLRDALVNIRGGLRRGG